MKNLSVVDDKSREKLLNENLPGEGPTETEAGSWKEMSIGGHCRIPITDHNKGKEVEENIEPK